MSRPLAGRLLAVGTSPDGRWIGYANNGSQVAFAGEADGRVLRTVQADGFGFIGGDQVIVGRGDPAGIRLAKLDLRSGTSRPTRCSGRGPDDFFSITDDNRMWARLSHGTIQLRELPSGRLLHELPPSEGIGYSDVNFRAGGSYLVISSLLQPDFGPTVGARFAIWQVKPWRLVGTVQDPTGNFPFTVDRAGHTFAVGHQNGSITLYNLSAGKHRELRGRHTAMVQDIAFAPNPSTLVSSGDDAQVIVWDVPSGELRETLHGHGGRALGIAFSRDGNRVHTVSLDGTAITWDLRGTRRFGRLFRAGCGQRASGARARAG